MALYLTPFQNDACYPFRSFNRDIRLLNKLAAFAHDDSRYDAPRTLRPNYAYEADDNGVHFELEMPGVSKEDIVVQVTGQKLVVKGKRFRENPEDVKADTQMHDSDKPAEENNAVDNKDKVADPSDPESSSVQRPTNERPTNERPTNERPTNEKPTNEKPADGPTPAMVYEFETKLAHRADMESVKAEHVGNGVLRVHITKKARPETRTIDIQ